jgi:hypothetical protein
MTTSSKDRLATVLALAETAIEREHENAHLALIFAAVQVARLRRISDERIVADLTEAMRRVAGAKP